MRTALSPDHWPADGDRRWHGHHRLGRSISPRHLPVDAGGSVTEAHGSSAARHAACWVARSTAAAIASSAESPPWTSTVTSRFPATKSTPALSTGAFGSSSSGALEGKRGRRPGDQGSAASVRVPRGNRDRGGPVIRRLPNCLQDRQRCLRGGELQDGHRDKRRLGSPSTSGPSTTPRLKPPRTSSANGGASCLRRRTRTAGDRCRLCSRRRPASRRRPVDRAGEDISQSEG